MRNSPRSAIQATADFLRRAMGVWGGVSALAVAGFLVVGAAILGFVALADEVLEGETQRLDETVLQWVVALRRPWLEPTALQITALGNVATIVVVGLIAAAILWASRRKISVLLLFLSMSTGTLVTFVLKDVFARPRPQVVTHIAGTMTSSFPSAHAMLSAVTYGTVAYLIGRMARRRARWVTWMAATLLILLIGLSRLYVGVHYPSDVLAGWLGGVAWVGVLVLIFRLRHIPDAWPLAAPSLPGAVDHANPARPSGPARRQDP